MTKSMWENKLAAWLHDPAEKCFVLFHDPAGHEGGTVKLLLNQLKNEIGLEFNAEQIKHADHLAASADRPQWPRDLDERKNALWSQVDFGHEPVLIHPLTGDELKLYDLSDIDYKKVKEISGSYFEALLKLGNDAKMKFLALWRFAPENREHLGQLWQLLPADTRTPDHSIWNHLDLTSAFAGAMAGGEKMAILAMTFGPVQSFIAQARSTSDLWAGSHLLSSIVWEGMKVIADEVGPDSFLFPQIRGLAVADLWLFDKAREAGLENEWKEQFKSIKAEWLTNSSDSNPLFSACLPNKFSAVVPLSRVEELANKVATSVRQAVKTWASDALNELKLQNSETAQKQLQEQLEEFPNVYWSAIEWCDDVKDKSEKLQQLKEACSMFTDEEENFFNSDYWKCLKSEVVISGKKFWEPRSSVVYPALYDLSEKSLAASKSLRNFSQMPQQGFRCTLCSEREWLTDDRKKLFDSPGQRKNTVWADSKEFFIKKDEHLCAICALKRLWPRLFIEKIKDRTSLENISRYVISTHTMSLVPTLKAISETNSMGDTEKLLKEVDRVITTDQSVSLPKKLYRECPEVKRKIIKRIPAHLDQLKDENELMAIEELYNDLKRLTGKKSRPETYYALILMDGDNMGAWLSATENERRIPYSKSWHPKVRENATLLKEKNANVNLDSYFKTLKTASPVRHAAISQALNSFSSVIVPKIIEDDHCGKLLYSGGDDVLAMAPTDDVISIIAELRMAYSGFGKSLQKGEKLSRTQQYSQKGFVLQKGRLMQTMGINASASVGVVIAHHQTPLAYALKCLREAEQRAKNSGRNAFCIRILKRAGGEISFSDNWWNDKQCPESILKNGLNKETSTLGLFEHLIRVAAQNDKMSRKAFYAVEEWIHLLPDFTDAWTDKDWSLSKDMAAKMLAKQFAAHGTNREFALELVEHIWQKAQREKNKSLKNPMMQLKDLLFCAEFFARETRSYAHSSDDKNKESNE